MKKPRKTKTQKYIDTTFMHSCNFAIFLIILARGCAWDLAAILIGIGCAAIIRAFYNFFRYGRCPECGKFIFETKRKVLFCVALLILIGVGSRLRICKIDSQVLFLFNKPNVAISSAKQDIRKDFESHGKTPENALSITYIGSNRSTRYYLCEYAESDGTVSIYYASEDNNLNSSERAKVLWDF